MGRTHTHWGRSASDKDQEHICIEFSAHTVIESTPEDSLLNRRDATQANHLFVRKYAASAFLGRALVIVRSWHALLGAFPYLDFDGGEHRFSIENLSSVHKQKLAADRESDKSRTFRNKRTFR